MYACRVQRVLPGIEPPARQSSEMKPPGPVFQQRRLSCCWLDWWQRCRRTTDSKKPIVSAVIPSFSLVIVSQRHDPILIGIRFEPRKRPTSHGPRVADAAASTRWLRPPRPSRLRGIHGPPAPALVPTVTKRLGPPKVAQGSKDSAGVRVFAGHRRVLSEMSLLLGNPAQRRTLRRAISTRPSQAPQKATRRCGGERRRRSDFPATSPENSPWLRILRRL
jgi:hypothetical protein